MKLLSKLIFILKKPNLILTVGSGKDLIAEATFQTLKNSIRIKKVGKVSFIDILTNRTLIIPFLLEENLDFFIQNSKKTIILIGEIEKKVRTIDLIRKLKPRDVLIFNADDPETRELQEKNKGKSLGFGFQKRADLTGSELNRSEEETNFKLDFDAKIIPVWLKGYWKNKEIFAVLSAIGCSLQFDLNLVEISQALKKLQRLD